MTARSLETHPIHLGRGGTAIAQPTFPDDERAMRWYEEYETRHGDDGAEGRLIGYYSFSGDWTSWEMHPAGAEVVICLEGTMTLVQEIDGAIVRTTLAAGEYAINPPGIWHTADIAGRATALFITPGMGTQHRPR